MYFVARIAAVAKGLGAQGVVKCSGEAHVAVARYLAPLITAGGLVTSLAGLFYEGEGAGGLLI